MLQAYVRFADTPKPGARLLKGSDFILEVSGEIEREFSLSRGPTKKCCPAGRDPLFCPLSIASPLLHSQLLRHLNAEPTLANSMQQYGFYAGLRPL